MKYPFFYLASAIAFFSSCEKSEEIMPISSEERQTPYAEFVPSVFTQKLLMELYSTTGCATCPDAEHKYRQYAAAHQNKVYAVSIHNADAMDHAQFDVLDNTFNITAYSSGSFNRLPFNNEVVKHKTTWSGSMVNSCLNKSAKCGLKIQTSRIGNAASVTITTGFNSTVSGDIRLSVYLSEDSVSGTGSGYNQANYYNNISTSPFFQLGNPIIGYQHNYVLRQVLTPSFGELIPQSTIKKSGIYKATYSLNTSSYDADQLYIIAFVNRKGTSILDHEILNVQQVKLGASAGWD